MAEVQPSQPKGSMRRKLMTGAAIGILAAGFYLGTLFDGWGFGTGQSGDGSGDADAGGTAVDLAPENTSVDLGNPSLVRPDTTPAPAPQPAVQVVTVLVKGDGYGLLTDPQAKIAELATPLSQHFRDATLAEVVSAAQAAPGNSDHVKVQIVKHKSSTVGRTGELDAALKAAGLPEGTVQVYVGSHE